MKKSVKIIVEVVLLVAIVGLVYAIYSSITKPVNFNKQLEARKAVAVQRLKDIRSLEVAFKGENNKFTANIDSLINYYKTGEMSIVMQIGSVDDSLAWEHTQKVKKGLKGKGQEIDNQLKALYDKGDKNLVFSAVTKIPVRDTLFRSREDFCADSLATIPFSGGEPIIMNAVVRMVSGVPVPLFEAKMPYKLLCKGMDNQLRINLDADCRDKNRFEGLQVGSVDTPNNNAGNWE
ncbi:MAG: hypothetical protein Q4F39_03210 [Bacteroidia bacterium]|nr:hypothetical protein [Bacteroidia bacterium]